MKKLLLVLIAIVGISFAAQAQSNAIGVRIGGGQGYGTEISFLKGLEANRIEVDLGYYGYGGYGSFGLSGIYQRHFDIASVPNLGWFAGVGGRVNYISYASTKISLGVLAQAGIDYRLDVFPLHFSLDIRPCLYLYPATSFQWGDIALGVRYMF